MDFDPDQHLAVTKVIIELTNMSEGSDSEPTERLLHKKM